MPLNKSKGNMYPWITDTHNPLAGKCPHGCTYCSTHKLAKQYPAIKRKYSGDIRLEEKEVKINIGKGKFIFVVAQNDLFAEDIPHKILWSILDFYTKFDNRYLFQSKNPKRMLTTLGHSVWDKSVACTTIESDTFYPEIMGNTPHPMQRSIAMEKISKSVKTFVTIEPIMDFHLDHFVRMIKRCNPKQVNIGADSGNNNLPEPPKEKVLQLIKKLEAFTKVEQKSNLKRIIK